jgi:hypothetical protein
MIARGADRDRIAVKRGRYWKALEMLEGAIPGSRLAELLRFELEALDALPPKQAAEP